MKSGIGTGRAFAAVLGVAVAAGLVVAAPAAATSGAAQSVPVIQASTDTDSDSGTVTWSVRPGDESGQDGRSWVELTADPGDVVTEHMVVVNHSRRAVQFALTAADGYFTETGRFTMLPQTHESVDAGLWIGIPESVEVGAGQSVVVPFTITVPDNASPGDHPAGVAASIMSGEGTIGVDSRVGFRVMTRVTGEWSPGIAVAAEAAYTGSINPFEAGRVTVDYRLDNTGNMRLGAAVGVTSAGPLGIGEISREGEAITEFAPGENRTGTIVVRPVWPAFVTTVEIAAEPTAASADLPFVETDPATSTITVVTVPWSQLVVIAIVILLVVLWWRGRKRRTRTMEEKLEQARESGRQEAAREQEEAVGVDSIDR